MGPCSFSPYSFSSETLTVFGLFSRACWENLEDTNVVPEKTYGTVGIWTPALGPVRELSESLGIKGM